MREKIKKFFIHKLNGLYPEWAIMRAKQDFAVKFDKYIVVDLQGERSVGDQETIDYETEQITYGGIREANLNIQAFGEGAVEALSTLWLLLQRASDVNECNDEGIAVLSASDVKDLTGLLDNRAWQERASIDLTVSYSRNIEYKGEFFTGFDNVIGYIGDENIYQMEDNNIVRSKDDYNTTEQAYNAYTKKYGATDMLNLDISPQIPIKNGGAETLKRDGILQPKDTFIAKTTDEEFEYTIEKIDIPFELEYK